MAVNNWKRTYLYVKTHRKTGLKYFGKTTKDPFKYTGSGILWKRHLAKHGNEVDTEVIGWFDSPAVCRIVALWFSAKHGIVESDGWANLRKENGFDGAPVGHDGHRFSEQERQKLSEVGKRRWSVPTEREAQAKRTASAWTPERRAKHAELIASRWTEDARAQHAEKLRKKHAQKRLQKSGE